MMEITTDELVARIRRDALRSALLLPRADDRQWETAPIPRPRTDTTERAKGVRPPDPTADTAIDPRRLAVREAVTAVRMAQFQLRTALDALERSIERWDGGR